MYSFVCQYQLLSLTIRLCADPCGCKAHDPKTSPRMQKIYSRSSTVRAISKKWATFSSGVEGMTPWPRFVMCGRDPAAFTTSTTRFSMVSRSLNSTHGSRLP